MVPPERTSGLGPNLATKCTALKAAPWYSMQPQKESLDGLISNQVLYSEHASNAVSSQFQGRDEHSEFDFFPIFTQSPEIARSMYDCSLIIMVQYWIFLGLLLIMFHGADDCFMYEKLFLNVGVQ